MAPPIELALFAAAFVGHFSIAVWLFNRLHALALPRPTIKVLEKALLGVAATVVAVVALFWMLGGRALLTGSGTHSLARGLGLGYGAVCWLAAAAVIPLWLIPKLRQRTPACLLTNDTSLIDVPQRLGFRPVHGAEAQFFARIPGNELLLLAVARKTVLLSGLPRKLDGMTIAHLSDLHMTGQLGREFYDVVVDETNRLGADLVVITGDILEKEPCLPWIGPTLGRLQSRHGKYFILGNHETRLPDVRPLRQALCQAGLKDLGGNTEVLMIAGEPILLAGTELPWFGDAPTILSTEYSTLSTEYTAAAPTAAGRIAEHPTPERRTLNPEPSFRLLLSHSPDQLSWAKAHGFDLMLAGHNHGGQIRLPYLGALITPSHYGFRYAGGLYFEPPTVLHVSRGIAGVHPIRLNCPPELALLELRSA